MPSHTDPPRLGLALALAPLAAPLSVVVVAAMLAIVSPRPGTEGINPIAGLLFGTVLLVAYGAPLAYGATFVVLWPAALLLRKGEAFTWWSMSLIATVGGGVLLPAYVHLLDPRGTTTFFPGAGFIAGASTGWLFWFIATRRASGTGDPT